MSVWKKVRVFKVVLENFIEDQVNGQRWCSNYDSLNVIAESAEEAIQSVKKIAAIEYPKVKVRAEEVTTISDAVYTVL